MTEAISPAKDSRRPTRFLSWIIRHSYRREICGLSVAVANWDPASVEAVFAKLGEAVKLLERHDARAFRELLHSTQGVFVFGTMGGVSAEWWRDDGLVMIQYEYAADVATTSEALAMVLAHEAMHVWLERHGFRYVEGRRSRVEGICRRRELRLAHRLPNAERLVASLERVPRCDPADFTNTAFHERAVSELERLGTPSWLISAIELWSSWRNRLARAWRGTDRGAGASPRGRRGRPDRHA